MCSEKCSFVAPYLLFWSSKIASSFAYCIKYRSNQISLALITQTKTSRQFRWHRSQQYCTSIHLSHRQALWATISTIPSTEEPSSSSPIRSSPGVPPDLRHLVACCTYILYNIIVYLLRKLCCCMHATVNDTDADLLMCVTQWCSCGCGAWSRRLTSVLTLRRLLRRLTYVD